MLELLLSLTLLALVAGTVRANWRGVDALHPMLFLGPLFAYSAVVEPWLVRNELERFFSDSEGVLYVLCLNLTCVVALVLGTIHEPAHRDDNARFRTTSVRLRPHERQVLIRIAFVLCVCALLSYSYSIISSGGFVVAYSQAKGGGRSASGYLSESMNLSLVAAAMAALSRYRQGWSLASATAVLAGLLPNLLQGTFGGRRGPLFLALAAGFLSWSLTRVNRPKVWIVWPSLAIALLAVVFIGSQRQFLHLGSDETVNWDEFTQSLAGESTNEGNNFIYGTGLVLTTRAAGQYTWGRELLVNVFIRPIPRQLWPTKYEDVGATWVTSGYPGLGNVSQADWLATVGWLPLAGSSASSISDLYGEFWWGAVIAFYLIGRKFGLLNALRRRQGGVWELLYLEALILSIYLASQSFSAFYHRFLILAVPTVVAWQWFVRPRSATGAPVRRRLRRRPRPAPVPM